MTDTRWQVRHHRNPRMPGVHYLKDPFNRTLAVVSRTGTGTWQGAIGTRVVSYGGTVWRVRRETEAAYRDLSARRGDSR